MNNNLLLLCCLLIAGLVISAYWMWTAKELNETPEDTLKEEVNDIEEIKKLFPLEVNITQEIIDKAELLNAHKCIGALALQSVLPKRKDGKPWSWGSTEGNQWQDNKGRHIVIGTAEKIDLMQVTIPRTITFILK